MPKRKTLKPVALTRKAGRTKTGRPPKGKIPPALLPFILARRAGKRL